MLMANKGRQQRGQMHSSGWMGEGDESPNHSDERVEHRINGELRVWEEY